MNIRKIKLLSPMKIPVSEENIAEILDLKKYTKLFPAVLGHPGIVINGRDVSSEAFRAAVLNAKKESIEKILQFQGKIYSTNGLCGHLESGAYLNIKSIFSITVE